MDREEAHACCRAINETLGKTDITFLDLENARIALSMVADHLREAFEENAQRHGVTSDLIVARNTLDQGLLQMKRASPYGHSTARFAFIETFQGRLRDAGHSMAAALSALEAAENGHPVTQLYIDRSLAAG